MFKAWGVESTGRVDVSGKTDIEKIRHLPCRDVRRLGGWGLSFASITVEDPHGYAKVGCSITVDESGAELADERFLGTVLGWVLGFVFALLFAVFAYLYHAVAVILAMAAFGFAIGSGLIVALGIDWNWVAVLGGVAVGAVVGLVSVLGNMPMIVLAVISSFAGAVGVFAGSRRFSP